MISKISLLENLSFKNLQQKYNNPYCHHIVSIYHEKNPIPQYSGNLFLSGIQGLHKKVVTDYGISAVLTIMDDWTYGYDEVDRKIQENNLMGNHKWINLQDDTQSSIYKHLEQGLNFIEQNLKTKNVLVHCHMGISRSASMVLAFLMKNFGMTFQQAYVHIIDIRDTIEPNDTFTKQLKKFEVELREKKVIVK